MYNRAETWLEWQSTCLASARAQVQVPVLPEKKKKKKCVIHE
jgi:hypothetical protein